MKIQKQTVGLYLVPKRHKRILGVNFYSGDLPPLLELVSGGGLVVVPSAPVLVDLRGDAAHREAVQNSDVAIVDSGLLMLVWLATKGKRLKRISGLRFIKSLIGHPDFRKEKATFWVMPSEADMVSNLAWLQSNGIHVTKNRCYVAPHYPKSGAIRDAELAAQIEKTKPPFIMINLGGGVQERLGYYLKEHLSYRPAIICTGAAIAFLSGRQTKIPNWADRAMLGWLMRCISAPKLFVPRYWKAGRLVGLVMRHGSESPVKAN